MEILNKLKEIIEGKGFRHISDWDDNGTECNLFCNGNDIIKIEYLPDADEETLEECGYGHSKGKARGKFIQIPNPPGHIGVEVTQAEFKITKDDRHKDGRIELKQANGFVFAGMLVKNLYRGEAWHKILPKLNPLFVAIHGGNCPLQIDAWYKDKWHTIWNQGNDFESFAQEKRSTDAYNNFALREGKKVARLIDSGMTYSKITKSLSDQHSGNTFGWAIAYGIAHAKDRGLAEKSRLAHNRQYGIKDSKGVVNPSVLTLSVK